MRKLVVLCCLLAIGFSFVWASKLPRAVPEDKYTPGMLIIQIKQEFRGTFTPITKGSNRTSLGLASLDGVCRQFGVYKIEPLFYDPKISDNERAVKYGLDLMYVLYIPVTTDIKAALRKFLSEPTIDCGMPNVLKRLCATPNDPQFGSQWGLTKIQAPAAWDVTQGDSTVILSIVDSGCEWVHQDLGGNMWINTAEDINSNGIFDPTPAPGGDLDGIDNDGNGLVDDVIGYDFTDLDNDPRPPAADDHGTHCNGIAGATTI